MALIHLPFFTCLPHRIKKRKQATTFKLLQHTLKHAVTTEDRILIRHYRLDKSIGAENVLPNNPDMNPADYSILEKLSQRLYKHQKKLMHASISLDIVTLKVIEAAGKHVLNIFSRFAVERSV